MATDWQIGDRIEKRWEIHKILKGGMGVVYVVYDHEHRAAYAAKTFRDEVFARDPSIAERFNQEALSWVKLDVHQNVTRAEFVETIAGKPFIFLEYVSGGDLSRWIGTPRLTEDLPQVLRFAIQFCDGMIHVFSKGITAHRDIKPTNCLITEDKILKVTDFGLAKLLTEAEPDDAQESSGLGVQKKPSGFLGRLFGRREGIVSGGSAKPLDAGFTRTGAGAGTPPYMAPEQFDDLKRADIRADIYSFGVMLFQMTTGKLPFAGNSWEEFKRRHQAEAPPKLNTGNAKLEEIVQTCLAKPRAMRFQDFIPLRETLVEVYLGLTGKEAPRPAAGKELDARGWANKGVSLCNLGKPAEAIACYDKALAIAPSFAGFWSNKGSVFTALGQPAEAIGCYDRALAIDPDSIETWYNKGLVLAKLGKPAEAIGCYDKVLAIDPRFSQAWIDRGSALALIGQPNEAIGCYDKALAIDQRLAGAWSKKGHVLQALLGQSVEAIVCYDKALAIDPHDAVVWRNKGAILAKTGGPAEAIGCYDRALAIDPHDAISWYGKGVTLQNLGQSAEAIACFEKALTINPRLEGVWKNKGFVLAALGQSAEAIVCFDRALAIDPGSIDAWYNKGAVLVNLQQNFREALTCFEEAGRLGHPQASQGIALCRQALGN